MALAYPSQPAPNPLHFQPVEGATPEEQNLEHVPTRSTTPTPAPSPPLLTLSSTMIAAIIWFIPSFFRFLLAFLTLLCGTVWVFGFIGVLAGPEWEEATQLRREGPGQERGEGRERNPPEPKVDERWMMIKGDSKGQNRARPRTIYKEPSIRGSVRGSANERRGAQECRS